MIANLFQQSGQAQLCISLTPLPIEWPKLNLLPTEWPKLTLLSTEWPKLIRVIPLPTEWPKLTLLSTEWPKLIRVIPLPTEWPKLTLLSTEWTKLIRILVILWTIGLGLENEIQSVRSILEKTACSSKELENFNLLHTEWWLFHGGVLVILDAIWLTDGVLFLIFESWFLFFISSKENDTNFCSIILHLDHSSAQYF